MILKIMSFTYRIAWLYPAAHNVFFHSLSSVIPGFYIPPSYSFLIHDYTFLIPTHLLSLIIHSSHPLIHYPRLFYPAPPSHPSSLIMHSSHLLIPHP